MHDPEFVALEIHLPIPLRRSWRDAKPGEPRWSVRRRRRTNPENLGQPIYPWWRPVGYEAHLAGRSWCWWEAMRIWHREPGGHDAGDICHYPRGMRLLQHLHHLHLQVPPLQTLRRRALTRCAWCGQRSGRGRNVVNVSLSWDGPRGRWWQGEPGLYHSECTGVLSAHRSCLCAEPVTVQPGYGPCSACGRYRGWGMTEAARQARLLQRALPEGTRPTPQQTARIHAEIAEAREAQGA